MMWCMELVRASHERQQQGCHTLTLQMLLLLMLITLLSLQRWLFRLHPRLSRLPFWREKTLLLLLLLLLQQRRPVWQLLRIPASIASGRRANGPKCCAGTRQEGCPQCPTTRSHPPRHLNRFESRLQQPLHPETGTKTTGSCQGGCLLASLRRLGISCAIKAASHSQPLHAPSMQMRPRERLVDRILKMWLPQLPLRSTVPDDGQIVTDHSGSPSLQTSIG